MHIDMYYILLLIPFKVVITYHKDEMCLYLKDLKQLLIYL